MNIDMKQVHATDVAFVKAVANYFTCSNLGGMVDNWRRLYEDCSEEESVGVLDEHTAWSEVACGMLKIINRDGLPKTLETADKLWADPNTDLGKIYEENCS